MSQDGEHRTKDTPQDTPPYRRPPLVFVWAGRDERTGLRILRGPVGGGEVDEETAEKLVKQYKHRSER